MTDRARALVPELRSRGVQGVVLSFVDTAGIDRIKAVPLERLEGAATWGVGMSPVFDAFRSDDVPMSGPGTLGGPDGDLRHVPDLDRLVVLDAQPGWAWAPVDRRTQDGDVHPGCARGFARRQVEAAAADGLRFRMGIEVEWAVSHGDGDTFVPACTGPAYGMVRLLERSDYLRDVMVALQRQGLDVEQIHPEYSDGQYEVSVAPADPVTAADHSVLVRTTIRAVSARHGLRVSFAPSVVHDHVGNGGHVHLSVWRGDVNLLAGGTGPYGTTDGGAAAVAGVLDELPALLAVGAPTPASYLRLVPSHWAGVFAAWGHETRETALRLVTGSRGEQGRRANLEVKCVDLAANPYLLVGSLMAAARHGIRTGATLPPPVVGDPAFAAEDDRPARLPTSLGEALARFAGSDVLRSALGERLTGAIEVVRRGEIDRVADLTPEQVVAAYRWIF
ncbi:glutamine synthetase family protein [Pseudonocardia endophytica]|uniref:L-glutamine synthetase n=1 Tax=Pseudonocardia endophytica TaxID=401976 RepID=A0A4R1HRD9_PSEEN|nr:glutamine synthetase family protein [Pseudonocardia endophytica]TCK19942.1 L-glutamine synthetase [Pseudonocardia endophytica]